MNELSSFTTKELLNELCLRGQTFAPVARAQLLVLAKSVDYNRRTEVPGAARDVYFPFGIKSHAQMIHTKSQRFVSLADANGPPNFEGLDDTALDLINYASFFLEWRERTGKSQ